MDMFLSVYLTDLETLSIKNHCAQNVSVYGDAPNKAWGGQPGEYAPSFRAVDV